MNYLYLLSILIIGLSGIVAQVMLLRELLVSFYGNELTLGVMLANWIMSEAIGVFIIGKFIDKIKNRINVFVILQIIFSSMLPLSVYSSRIVKSILGIPFGQAMGLSWIFYSSLFIIFPVGFCHGALFSCSCNIYNSYMKEPARSIGKVYTWETIGTLIGGIVLTYLFIPRLNSFQIAFIIALFNFITCLVFFKDASKIFKYIPVFLIFLAGYMFASGSLTKMQDYAIKRQWHTQEVLDYRNSIYGNIVVVKKEEQRTFFYNGLPIITTPYPDITFVQEFGNLPLLFHPDPKDILVITGGAGGLINEILKHPVKRVDYAELDPLVIEMLRKYHSSLTQRELGDNRVNIITKDGRLFVRNTPRKYDVALIGLSKPSDLSSNRVFTEEFFALIKKRLNSGGILAFCLPGSLAYLSNQLKDLNACILNGLKSTYSYIRIIPGDYNMFLASDSMDLMRIDSKLIAQRISQNNIKADVLVPAYLDYRLDKRWLEWFNRSSIGATKKINRDFMPFAVFQMLVFWNKQFSPGFSGILEALGNLDLRFILVFVCAMTLVLFLILFHKYNLAKLTVIYSIATTGFFGMLMSLILIFSFQVIFGYMYYRIGILISIFMAGTAIGSIFMMRNFKNIKSNISLFVRFEAIISLFSYLSAVIITAFLGHTTLSAVILMVLFFISGLLVGLEFPLAIKIYLTDRKQLGFTSGLLYFSDLIGGWVAGIAGAVVILPILGLFNACMVIVLLKLSSLLLLVVFSKRLTNIII